MCASLIEMHTHSSLTLVQVLCKSAKSYNWRHGAPTTRPSSLLDVTCYSLKYCLYAEQQQQLLHSSTSFLKRFLEYEVHFSFSYILLPFDNSYIVISSAAQRQHRVRFNDIVNMSKNGIIVQIKTTMFFSHSVVFFTIYIIIFVVCILWYSVCNSLCN